MQNELRYLERLLAALPASELRKEAASLDSAWWVSVYLPRESVENPRSILFHLSSIFMEDLHVFAQQGPSTHYMLHLWSKTYKDPQIDRKVDPHLRSLGTTIMQLIMCNFHWLRRLHTSGVPLIPWAPVVLLTRRLNMGNSGMPRWRCKIQTPPPNLCSTLQAFYTRKKSLAKQRMRFEFFLQKPPVSKLHNFWLLVAFLGCTAMNKHETTI